MPKKDAIKDDVSKPEDDKLVAEAKDNANSQRLDTMQELAAKRREERDAEMRAEGIEPVDTTGEPDNTVAEDHEIEGSEKEVELKIDDEKVIEEKAVETRTLKVNGEDIEVPLSKILDAGQRTLQKESAADAKLAEASQILRDAQAKADATKPSSDQDVVQDDSSPSTIDAKKLAKTMIDGDLEEVTDAVQQLVGAGRQSSKQTATQIQNMDRSEVFGFVQDAINLEAAMNKFKNTPENGGFSDLHNDPSLRKMVMDKEEELVNAGDTRGYVERLTDAATEIREWRNGMMKDAGLAVNDFKDRQDKKKAADSTTEIAGGRQTKDREEKPKSRSESRKISIEKMAASRGQRID